MKGSALEQMARWLGTVKWNEAKPYIQMATVVAMLFVVVSAYLMGRTSGIQSVTRGDYIIQRHENATILIEPDGDRTEYQNAITVEFKKPDFACTLQSDGLPVGYTLFKNDMGEWSFKDESGYMSDIDIYDTKDRAINRAQSWCKFEREKEARKQTKWSEAQ